MATKKILIQVILDDKASGEQKKVQGALSQTTNAIKKMTAEEEKQFIAQEKLNIQNKLYINELRQKAQAELFAADSTARSRAQAGLNNAILLETGRLASDVNFGFTAIANNLSQVVTLFSSFVRTSDGIKGAFKELGKSIMGTGGILIAVQLLIGFLPRLDKIIKNLRGRTLDLNDVFKKAGEEVSDIAGKFETYIGILQDSTESEEQKQIAIKNLNEEFPDFVQNLKDANVSMDDIKNSTESATAQIDLQREAIIKLAKSRAAQAEIDKIVAKDIQDRINLENELREEGIELDEEVFEKAKFYLEEREKVEKIQSSAKRTRMLRDLANEQEAGVTRAANFLLEQEENEEKIKRLLEFIDIENKAKRKNTDEDNKYTKLRIQNLDLEIQAIKDLGRIRKKFFELNQKQDVKDKESAEEKLQLRRIQALAEVDVIKGSEAAKRQARLEINTYFDKLDLQQEEATAEAKKSIQLSIVSSYAKALGSLSQLLGKNTAAGKVAALGEIAAGTAVGFIQALDIAQKAAKGTGPLASLAFPVFYASQVAAVLGAAAQAKQVLESGGRTSASRPTAGTTAPSITTEAPDFNVVGIGQANQLGQIISGQFAQPLRAYVLSDDVKTGQALQRNITGNAKLG